MFKHLRHTIHTILVILLFILLPVAIFSVVISKVPISGIRSFVIVSGSMAPALPVGTLIYVQQQPAYAIGDVITFTTNDTSVTHRVVQIEGSGGSSMYTTKGDANNTVDVHTTSARDVIGKEIIAIPKTGYVISFLNTFMGILTLVLLPGILLIILELHAIRRELAKEMEKKYLKQTEMNHEGT